MIEFELIIVKFLYQNGCIWLPGIGIITLKGNVPDVEHIKKNTHLPLEGLEFEFKPNVEIQPEFVDFFAAQRGKIRSLANSDIESRLQLTKQLLNIGNPYDIPGIGVLQKINDGSLKLDPGFYINSTQELTGGPYKLKEREDPKTLKEKFDAESNQSTNRLNKDTRKLLLGIITILLLVVIAWIVYSQFLSGIKLDTPDNEQVITNSAATTIDDSIVTPITNEPVAIPVPPSGIMTYKVYVRNIGNKAEALRRYNTTYKNWTNKIYIESNSDSTNFNFYVLLTTNVADTTAKKDSLSKFYTYPVSLVPTNPQ